jgi:hypothetical protein
MVATTVLVAVSMTERTVLEWITDLISHSF